MSNNTMSNSQPTNVRIYARNSLEKAYHELQVILGKEVRCQRISAQKHLTAISSFKPACSDDTKKPEEDVSSKEFVTCNKTADSTESKEIASTKPNEEIWYEKRCNKTHYKVRIRQTPRLAIWLPLALIVLRMVFPEIEETLPHVYMFLDEVVIPIIEWMYKLALTFFRSLMNNESFMNMLSEIAHTAEGIFTF